jgi:hypothetical protein
VKKPEKESVQTAIRLPRRTHEWLQKRPAGITDSIKRGLELLAIEEDADEPTREFALLMFYLAREVELETGAKWHADPAAHRVFHRMVRYAMTKWRPANYNDNPFDKVEVTPFQERAHATYPINDADELGIALADRILRAPDRDQAARIRAVAEQSLKEIIQFQQQRDREEDRQ